MQANRKVQLSIVIVSYNTKDITLACLRSIENSLSQSNGELAVEVMLVDNNSTDGSVEAIRKESAGYKNFKINLIENKENTGFGKANNQGVSEAQGEVIFLLNSDTEILEDGLKNLYDSFISHPKVKFLGPRLLNVDKTPQASCGHFYTLPIVFAALFLRGDYYGLTRWAVVKWQRVDWISGAAILTRKETFQALSGFDEGIFMYMEEIDLLYRASQKGYETWVEPKAELIHIGSASSNKTYPIIQVFRGFSYFYKKHYSRFDSIILWFMLELKAWVCIGLGIALGKKNLVETYTKAKAEITLL